jgi:E3 ubiquitin-protein ligase makorin
MNVVNKFFCLFSRKIHCKFFKRGDGLCPFGSKCFYLHVDKRGQPVDLGPPRRRQRLNMRSNLESLTDIFMLSLLSPVDVGRFFDEYANNLCFY